MVSRYDRGYVDGWGEGVKKGIEFGRWVAQSQARLEVLTERLERLEKAPAESPKRDGANKQEHPS
jgi:hypothetical protein